MLNQTDECKKEWEEKNKEKRSQYHKEWYQKNKKRKRANERKLYLKSEKYRKYKSELRKIRHHRKRSAVSNFTLIEWEKCKTFFDNECCYCGGKSQELQQDHFIQVAKNGEYTKTNIVPACSSCNSSKNDRDFFEWFKQQKYYSLEREIKILSYLGREINDSLSLYGCRDK
ncbi:MULTISPECIES: HNH endonuclease [unclassified Niallia]|uniref:HNH endonuclease n=1 Tax=unclassified Niallia TaxID=2837522 RepID=UPI0020401DA6|nr:HNH endonuclease signature motif containing protein [Niallia sp. MER 6]MCM3030358.1 HNH endonuclease [Niallia sp. MER 6]